MTTRTTKLPVPAPGENPHFDEVFEDKLSLYSDFIDEEKSRMWEAASDNYNGEGDPGADFRGWWRERYAELRAEAWDECQDQFIDPWEALTAARAETEALQAEKVTLTERGAEKDARIQRLQKRVRQLKKKTERTAESLYYAKEELKIDKDVIEYQREAGRCRNCGHLPEGNR